MKTLKISRGQLKIVQKKEQRFDGKKVAAVTKCGVVTTYFLGEKPPYEIKKVLE